MAMEAPRFFGSTFELEVETSEEQPITNPAPRPKLDAAEAAERAPALNDERVSQHLKTNASLVEDAPVPKSRALGQNSGSQSIPSEQRSASGSYGEEGQTEIRSQLRRAFIKTLPLAAKLDPSWLELDDGEIEGAVIELTLDQNGQLESVRARSGTPHPALLRAAVKNRAFLSRGRFKIQEQAGIRKLLIKLHATISTKHPDDSALVENKVIALGLRVDPRDKTAEPTGAYFTYDNGRHVEFAISAVEE